MQPIDSLLEYIDNSPTAWHAVANACALLDKAGFSELNEKELWNLSPGGRYYVKRNGSSLCAFILPEKKINSAYIVASHSDSPGFKLKPNAEFRKENMTMLAVEVYGAPLITSWLNRDLGIAGRVIYEDPDGSLRETLFRFDKSPVVLPQLAIHLDRKVNEEGLLLNKQQHLAVLAAIDCEGEYLTSCLKDQFSFKEILSHDLFLFPLEQAATVGKNKELVAAYRLDNLSSVFASLSALVESEPSEKELKIAVVWDHEEIGSETPQGASSSFLDQVIEKVCLALQMTREEFFCLLQRSLCVSVDMAHALHPNYPEKHEPQHPVLLGKGVAIKFNAQSRYATDASSASTILDLCRKSGIPWQSFVTRGDIPCGSTIGPVQASRTGIPTVDIGVPQLSMHSCRELMAGADYLSLLSLIKSFLY